MDAQAGPHGTNMAERACSIVSQDPCEHRTDGEHAEVEVLGSTVICREAGRHFVELGYAIPSLMQCLSSS